eukprot:scaffold90482_cov31-Tisochrysis_lutea.AAC.1
MLVSFGHSPRCEDVSSAPLHMRHILSSRSAKRFAVPICLWTMAACGVRMCPVSGTNAHTVYDKGIVFPRHELPASHIEDQILARTPEQPRANSEEEESMME